MIILYILLFIFCLSTLIMIHEAGHLAAAKIFHVYCFDYSIGFGPALLHVKRKRGETYFSIRAIPFGGFVSMYGEAQKDELPDGIESIPDERSLNNAKKWKRAIILSAGVIMNALLAIVLFFISACLPQQSLYLRYVDVEEGSIAANIGMKDAHVEGQTLIHFYDDEKDVDTEAKEKIIIAAKKEKRYVLDFDGFVTYLDDSTLPMCTMLDVTNVSFKIHDYDTYLKYYLYDESGLINTNKEITTKSEGVKSVTFNIYSAEFDEANKKWIKGSDTFTFNLNLNEGKFDPTGLGIALFTHQNNFGQVMQQTFTDFGESAILIFRAIGNLFIGRGWDQVGGIVSIFSQSTALISNYNISFFIRMWAIISVNLAIFNLLPFPGLDGWQLVVLFVETVAHKEIPSKVKGIISIVGISLLMLLMLVVLIKDVIGLF